MLPEHDARGEAVLKMKAKLIHPCLDSELGDLSAIDQDMGYLLGVVRETHGER